MRSSNKNVFNFLRIKVDVYEQLLWMGFPSGVIVEALKQTNSDLQLSLEAIQNHPEWYDVPDIPVEEPAWTGEITDDMLARVRTCHT